MNKALLLIIADFLLLSMLAIARFDPVPVVDVEAQAEVVENEGTSRDLIEVLQMSLKAENLARENAAAKLEKTVFELEDRSSELNKTKNKLDALSEEAKKLRPLKAELEDIEKEFKKTRDKLDKSQEDRTRIAKEMGNIKSKDAASTERVQMLQKQLKKRDEEFRKEKERNEELESAKRVAEQEKQTAETKLKVERTKTTMLETNLSTANLEIKSVKAEKMQAVQHASKLADGVSILADGVSDLADNSVQLKNEFREMQALGMNQIFEMYQTNRVVVEYNYIKEGLIGPSTRQDRYPGIVVQTEDAAVVLVHESATPLGSLSLRNIKASLKLNKLTVEVKEVYTLAEDPRILALRVPPKSLDQSGVDTFSLSINPLKFPRVVVIGPDGRYGEIVIKQHPQYVNYFKRDTKTFNRIAGEVKPKKGDLVFSQRAHLLGIMVNKDYFRLINSANPASIIALGSKFNRTQLSRVQDTIETKKMGLPPELR